MILLWRMVDSHGHRLGNLFEESVDKGKIPANVGFQGGVYVLKAMRLQSLLRDSCSCKLHDEWHWTRFIHDKICINLAMPSSALVE